MPAQADIYASLNAGIDRSLSWTEAELPERERTKHVHRLHPYLGKYVPQLVEIFLQRHFRSGDWILDPYSGSGTTLVEASVFGANTVGVDISAFNVKLGRVKTSTYDAQAVATDLTEALCTFESRTDDTPTSPDSYLNRWFHPRALGELLAFRDIAESFPQHRELLEIVLSRAARSARRTRHYNLDFPKEPALGPYHCRKHNRECAPVQEAAKFIRRYIADTIRRIGEYAEVRHPNSQVELVHGDAASSAYDATFDGLITSPPYPGRIDYHLQHEYAFRLLGLDARIEEEIGSAAGGTTKAAIATYIERSTAVFERARAAMRPGATAVVVVDDARDLYERILADAGWSIESRSQRHVNRRTGRRAGEFYEDIIVARPR
jgi:hypothetical protein